MGRPPSDLDDYLDWQQRLDSFKAGGLSIGEFCLREGVFRSTFYRWVDRLKDGIPEPRRSVARYEPSGRDGQSLCPLAPPRRPAVRLQPTRYARAARLIYADRWTGE